jgi:Heavy metal binding domain
MKKLIIVLVSVAHFMACNTDASKQNQATETKAPTPPPVETKAEVKADTAQVFACPMDPEIKGKKGDKCSKCGMDLVHKD